MWVTDGVIKVFIELIFCRGYVFCKFGYPFRRVDIDFAVFRAQLFCFQRTNDLLERTVSIFACFDRFLNRFSCSFIYLQSVS